MLKTREDAWKLVTHYTQSERLRKHMLAVECAMRAYARRFGEDEDLWGIVGLLHDFDYEKHQTIPDHPLKGADILRVEGWPEEIITAILSHADETGVPRTTRLHHTLYAVDELTGLITAVTLVRPSKNIRDVTLKSIEKKWKDRRFAAGVNREDIETGAAALGISLDEHIAFVLNAMQECAETLGLAGEEHAS